MNIAILFSGSGTNMRELTAVHSPGLNVNLLITNNPQAGGLVYAQETGIPTLVIDHRGMPREQHENELDRQLRQHNTDGICLAGYMRVLTGGFINRWWGKILNIHPSLLPAFPGLHTHARALEAGVKIHGCTVHLVTERVDDGPILGQAAVPVMPNDTPLSLGQRVLVQEHRLYPTVLSAFASAVSAEAPEPDAVLCNPIIA